ncbi:non-canonical purine NTP pyrophosphatase, RdgB/HAM1 family [candidate division WOR-1 bacterium RIFOXYA2_FULL_36_21]|uniref:dITP/XTP pyrophosphatase n=1 Tax=candidate division WOR-1 bacterium RIFOXYB2_FULL_36_35 TaxID=1802578 RepID=A0A1F4S541_UNCSA|nr:MAG: non-canonical purine NTP pyrophosphatase, RdgB/HAM1 family [candidate division WOR-1 bacterium RIFOXYA2_FULL_36_21]OGC15104.1 MAG: non-canonical purine NTP pyrophosphatase, RdgB/HAM1 family [candidate division WOR-1 bacterium RIFOXYA12_FULL_36_13]OGC15545.1 MAG: non-canonical purine NTP pyrophosphatase, RdgB/HAM1 family [candidate division WOR-1 bacterium RIFOXYB2_FULL_36_35]
MDIIVATTNKHKLEEIKKIFDLLQTADGQTKLNIIGKNIKVLEDGKIFEENALKKARAAARKFKKIGIADDSGLVVNALNGNPGIMSARYASPPTTKNLCGKLLKAMKQHKNRHAHFVCAMAIAYPNGEEKVVVGKVFGRISYEMKGEHGFGYDPVFIPRGYKKTFSEISPHSKNIISHRSDALKKLRKILKFGGNK